MRKIILWLMVLWLSGFTAVLDAADTDSVTVNLEKIEDRVHATVTSPEEVPVPVKRGVVDRNLKKVEKETIRAARTSGNLVGGGTDKAVKTVQKVSEPFFSRLIHALDFRKKHE